MKTVPASLRLIDFAVEAMECAPLPEAAVHSAPVEMLHAPEQLLSQKELDLAVSDARAEAEASAAEQLRQVREEYEQQLERERLDAIEVQAGIVLTRMTEEVAALGSDLAERLFEKCRPVLGALAREQAVLELVTILESIVRENCQLKVRGPGELLEALRRGLDGHGYNVDWQEDQVLDVSITMGDTIVETQLTEWFGVVMETVDG